MDHPRMRVQPSPAVPVGVAKVTHMTKWEYATVPLIVHATKQILDQWGEDGWELVQVVTGEGGNLVAYLKRQKD
jgi:hypothetical protein